MQDASGIQTFDYGNMGELIENIHTFVVPGGDPYTFKMKQSKIQFRDSILLNSNILLCSMSPIKNQHYIKWTYDSWNRIKDITYADGEVVNYNYNDGGTLISMSGVKGNQSFRYISDVTYNRYGSRKHIVYGNGSNTKYIYNMLNQQMTNLKSYDGNNNLMQDLSYTYDDVSNITKIQNSATSLSNGLGGSYLYSYTYDNLYRLTNASGNFSPQGMPQISQSLTMQYSASGNISSKAVTATTLNNGTTTSINYSNSYTYNTSQPHTVSQVGNNLYFWDNNGNMTQRSNSDVGIRNLCWDEENRLMGVTDFTDNIPNTTSAYIYNAGGERIWKFAGQVDQMSVNGDEVINVAIITDKTLYSSPYLVANGQNYTKHYFAGSERVCSKIGGGFLTNIITPTDGRVAPINGDEPSVSEDFRSLIFNSFSCSGAELVDITIEPFLNGIEGFVGIDEPENLLYYMHSDHLGSSSFITDLSGSAVQHLQYMPLRQAQGKPFGETFVNQTSTSWDARYKFTGKEKDGETGYSYFGARYYSSDLSIWLSVDPMSDERSWLSLYNYCQWNPVMLTDPTGMLDEVIITGDDADAATEDLNASTSLIITRDSETGKLSATGKAVTKYDKKLLKAITDKRVIVKIEADNEASTDYFGGGFYGNSFEEVTTTISFINYDSKIFEEIQIEFTETKVNTTQKVNPSQLKYLESVYKTERGAGMLHEVTESYIGALISKKIGIKALPASINSPTYWIYDKAHKKAAPQPGDKKVSQQVVDAYIYWLKR